MNKRMMGFVSGLSFLLIGVTSAWSGDAPRTKCSAVVSGAGIKTYQVGPPAGNDNAQIQCAVDAAINDLQMGSADSATVLLQPNATYHLEALPNFYDALSIKTSDLKKRTFANLTLNGQNSTLTLDPTTAGIYVNGCQNCALENFTLRTIPSPMSEGSLIAATATSADIKITKGTAFSVAQDYRPIIGKNARVAIFRVSDDQAFPTRYRFPSRAPYALVTSAANPSSDVVRIFSGDSQLLPALPINVTHASLIAPPLDAAKSTAMADVLARAAVIRQEHPEFGPQFFTGNSVAALCVEQNTNLAVRNVLISDFAGQGIHASYNRGPLLFDRIQVVPGVRTGVRSVGAAGIAARNNQVGPAITNSVVLNSGDDAIDTSNPPLIARQVQGNSVDLVAAGMLIQSISITAGDRFDLIDTTTGNSLGRFTATNATPFFLNRNAYGYRVTFNPPVPAGIITQGSKNPTTFVNLDQINSGAVIRGNLVMGGQRSGLIISSSATVEHNAFIGMGLWAIQYLPVVVRAQWNGLWSDFGAVTIADNTAIDIPLGLLRTSKTGASASYGVQFRGLTVTGNTVIAPTNIEGRYGAIYLNNPGLVPIVASGNTLVVSNEIGAANSSQPIIGRDNTAAWKNAFETHIATGSDDLWRAKCAKIAVSTMWVSAVKEAAPGACHW